MPTAANSSFRVSYSLLALAGLLSLAELLQSFVIIGFGAVRVWFVASY